MYSVFWIIVYISPELQECYNLLSDSPRRNDLRDKRLISRNVGPTDTNELQKVTNEWAKHEDKLQQRGNDWPLLEDDTLVTHRVCRNVVRSGAGTQKNIKLLTTCHGRFKTCEK